MQAISFREKLRMAGGGVIGVLKQPTYIVIALIGAVVFATIIYLSINWGLYGSLLLSSLPLGDKLATFGLMFSRMLGELVMTVNGWLLLIVSLLQGVNIALMIYTIKRNRRNNSPQDARKSQGQALGSGGIAAVAIALGLGCVPCGTSILLPILSIFFASSAYAATNVANIVVLGLAFLLSWYAIYKLGFVAFAYTEQERLKKEG